MSVANLPPCPTKAGHERTTWFEKAKRVWRAEFHAGGDPMAILAKGVSENTVRTWIRDNKIPCMPAKAVVPGPSRDKLLGIYLANTETERGKAALVQARATEARNVLDLVNDQQTFFGDDGDDE